VRVGRHFGGLPRKGVAVKCLTYGSDLEERVLPEKEPGKDTGIKYLSLIVQAAQLQTTFRGHREVLCGQETAIAMIILYLATKG